MANSPQAKKRARQNERRFAVNKARRSRIRTYLRKVEEAIDRLVPGAKKKLDEINPRLPKGYRKSKHHQHTTEDYGLPELKAHLIRVMAYMDAAANDTQFMRLMNRGCPKYGGNYELPLDDW